MLIYSAISGFLLGIIYDIFRSFERILCKDASLWSEWLQNKLPFPFNKASEPSKEPKARRLFRTIFLFFKDVGFCLLCAVTALLVSYLTNHGQFRVSVIALMLSGFVLYLMIVRKLFRLVWEAMLVVLLFVLSWVTWIVTFPICLLLRCMNPLILPLIRQLRAKCSQKIARMRQRVKKTARVEQISKHHLPRQNGKHYYSSRAG